MTPLSETQAAPALSSQFSIRPFALESDLPRLVRLRNEIEAVEHVDEGTSEEEMRVGIESPEHDPARDRWVVEEPGHPDRLIADGVSNKHTHAPGAWLNINVHPAWRRRGLGSALLERALARAREQGAAYVTTGANDRVPAGGAFLRRHGYTPSATWIDMRTPRHLALAEPAWPAGYQVRTYAEVQDLPTLLVAINRGFLGHWEHHDDTEESLAHWVHAPTTQPAGIFLAFGPAGDVAGLCWCDISAQRDARRGVPTGYIDSLAVVPEHRRHGLGRALLLTGLRWLEGQGKEVYELGAWGENEMALPLYYHVGFGLAQQGTSYRRELDGGNRLATEF